ncbi:hypothetical protein HpNP86_08980 [Helicobacter pylori]
MIGVILILILILIAVLKIGLFASVGGLALLLMTPVVGEIALIGGLVLGAIGIVKSVWSFFDSDYKKS